MNNTIKVFALGGLNENGKNMYVVSVNESIFIFDAGLKYGNDKMLGVDYIIPDMNYIKENYKNIKGIFLTHGHNENMGACKDILREFPDLPVFGTKLTMEILKLELEEYNVKANKLKEIRPHSRINFGEDIDLFPVSVTHSIPDAVLYVLYTKDGAIVYTGDFVFDSTMLGNYKTDIGKLAYVGKQGVLCLLSESYYADKIGHTSPNNRIRDDVKDMFKKNEGRIICNTFKSHLYRVQEIFDEVMKTNRNVVIMGKSLQDTINKAIDLDYIKFDKERIGTLNNLEDDNVVIIISDGKEKPYANLNKIIKGTDKYITLKESDTVFLSEPVYDGIEHLNAEVLDDLAIKKVNVVSLNKGYLLHHPSSEDLMLMINLMDPKYYFPVKGEYRRQYANGEVAEKVGIPKSNILLKQNGDVVTFVDGILQDKPEHIDVGEILIDGKYQGDVGELVLKDREMLGENGIVLVNCAIDKNTKEIIHGPELLTRGFIYVKTSGELIEKSKELCEDIIKRHTTNVEKVNYTDIKNDIREELGSFYYSETETKPMIITVVQEV